MEPISRFFNQKDWLQTTVGAGSITFADDGKSVICDAASGDRATLQYFVVGFPGDSFEFSVITKNIETGKSGFSELFIDSPQGTRRDDIDVESLDPENITLRYDIPVGANEPRVVVFGVGVSTGLDGSGQFMVPRVRRLQGNTFLRAKLRVEPNGGMVVHDTVPAFNVDDAGIVWDATNLEMVVTPKETTIFSTGAYTFKPAVLATGGPNNSVNAPVIWNAGREQNDGSFSVQALDAVTGDIIDLSAGVGYPLYVAVKMEL